MSEVVALPEPAARLAAITEPGVYELDAERYHADPVPGGSLSVSGARRLLPPGCPALFAYEREHRPVPTPAYDLGHAAHTLVLGAGPELVVVDAEDWRTKAARQARDEAHEAGAVPLLAGEHEVVLAMAQALLAHPIAAALLAPGRGTPEVSLFWRDPATGVMLRARLDWLPKINRVARMLVPDYKTCISASPERIERNISDFGYHQQAAWYLDGVLTLELATDAAFLLICQEKTPPYLVTVVEVDAMALRIGRSLNRQAIDIYHQCSTSGRWPGYADDVVRVGVPRWVENQYLREYE